MKTLIVIFAAAMSAAVFANETAPKHAGEAPAQKAIRPGRARAERGLLGGAMSADPILRMVLNPNVASQINLTDEQKAKIKELGRNGGAERDLALKSRKCMERQTQLLKAEQIDEAALMATIDEMFDARKQAAKAQMKRMIAARAVLTPDQIAKVEAMAEVFRAGKLPRAEKPSKPEVAPKAK